MKTTISFLFILFLCGVIYSQESDIFTFPDGQKIAVWKPGCSICNEFTVDGHKYKVFETPEFYLSYQLADDSDYYVANVYLVNKSDRRLEFDPAKAEVGILTESDLKNKRSATIYKPIPAEKIAAKINSRAKWSSFFTAMSGALAESTTQVNTQGSVRATDNRGNSANGTYQSTATVTAPNTEAQRTAREQIKANTENAARAAQSYTGTDLKANTLFKDGEIGGNIYFPRKKFVRLVLGIDIDGVMYLIRYDPPQK